MLLFALVRVSCLAPTPAPPPPGVASTLGHNCPVCRSPAPVAPLLVPMVPPDCESNFELNCEPDCGSVCDTDCESYCGSAYELDCGPVCDSDCESDYEPDCESAVSKIMNPILALLFFLKSAKTALHSSRYSFGTSHVHNH